MSAPQSEAFKQAVIDSKKLTSKPSNEDLLELYGQLSSNPYPRWPLVTPTKPFYCGVSLPKDSCEVVLTCD
jgi:hypothetical protein